MKIQKVSTNLLKLNKRNPRKNDCAVEAIGRSICKFGWTNPILVRKTDNTVIAGHARLKAAMKKGIKEVPVIFLNMSKVDADAYMLADNKLSEIAQWDEQKLNDMLNDLQKDIDIKLLGFDDSFLASTPNIDDELDDMPDIPDYMSFIVTKEQREEIEKCLNKQIGENRTEQLLCLIRKSK
jgi:ParB family chromosome partitioning protein